MSLVLCKIFDSISISFPPDIDECSREGCGNPLEDCLNSPGTYECICKTGYHKVKGQCQLEGSWNLHDWVDTEHLSVLAWVHAFLVMLGVTNIGVRLTLYLGALYLVGIAAFLCAKVYKESL